MTRSFAAKEENSRSGDEAKRFVVAITGATGAILGVRLLECLCGIGTESHLIMSEWGMRTLTHETSYAVEQVKEMATVFYDNEDQGAAISSGSFIIQGMVVVPCSMRTLSAIAHGLNDTLIHRTADVVLKEQRKLVLVVREAPLSEIHLENMLKLSRMGVVIVPPVPAFYNHPRTIHEMVDHIVMRVLDQLGIHLNLMNRWNGVLSKNGTPA